MKQVISAITSNLTQLIKAPLRVSIRNLWERNHKDWLIILAYHRVSDIYDPQIHLPRGWNQTSAFEREISFLSRTYKVLPLYDALQQLEAGNLYGGCIAITMDDGDSSVKSTAVPILKKYGCPATFFITSAYLQCDRLHFPFIVRYLANSPDPHKQALLPEHYKDAVRILRGTSDQKEYQRLRVEIENLSDYIPDKQRYFMTIRDLEELDPDLFSVGIHGHEHQRFSMMSANWQRDAIEKNIESLNRLEHYRPIFALPFGGSNDWNTDTVRICLDYNLYFLTCTAGVNLGKTVEYRRIFADGRDAASLISNGLTGIV